MTHGHTTASRRWWLAVPIALAIVGLWRVVPAREGQAPPPAPPPLLDAPVTAPAASGETPRLPTGPLDHTDTVECELVEPLVGTFYSAGVLEFDPDTLEPAGLRQVELLDEWIRFRPRHAEGLGRLAADGYAPVTIAWMNGACLELVEVEQLPPGRIVVTVEGGTPDAAQVVSSCGGVPFRYGEQHIVETRRDDPCFIAVGYAVGERFFPTASEEVVPVLGADVEISLPAPDGPPGLGWALQPSAEGLRVSALAPTGEGAAGGLQVGDVILAVDGEPVPLEAGPELKGLEELEPPVRLVLLRDGEELEIEIP